MQPQRVTEHMSRGFSGVLIVLLAGVLVVFIARSVMGHFEQWWELPVAIVTIVSAAALIMSPQRLTIDESVVQLAALYFFRVKLPREGLHAEVVTLVNPLHYGGWGLRLAGGALAFVTGKKPAVAFTTAEGRKYLFTTHRAESIVTTLAQPVS